MRLIKLTKDGVTKSNTKWEIGKTVSIEKESRKPKLCTSGVLHAYKSIEQALVMKVLNLYESDDNLKIYEVEGDIVAEDCSKVGCYELTPIRELPLPDWYINTELRLKILVRFACYYALEVIHIFEDKYPNDNRPGRAISETLKYGTGEFNTTNAVADATDAAARAVADAVADVINDADADRAVARAIAGAVIDTDTARAAGTINDTARVIRVVTYVASAARAAVGAVNDARAARAARAVADAVDYNININITELMQKTIKDFDKKGE